MAEESPTGGERTEEATAKRRADFRKKGQVAQSKEVQTAALLTILLLFWFFYLGTFWDKLSALLLTIWQSLDSFDGSMSATMNLAYFLVMDCAILMAPLFFLVVIIGIFSSFFQIGWLFTTKPLMPDLNKLNPISGFSRMFSKKSIVELLKSLAKVILVGWVAYSTIIDKFPEALLQTDTTIFSTLIFMAQTAGLVLAKVCGVMILIAFIDFFYQKWEMEEKMKMTKQEQKEEFKETEGDPHIKAQIRYIQQEVARRRMMADIPEADVVITNPTHISVALRYKSGEDNAPIVIAKGADFVAMKIREIARENDIPIIENPPVARMLHKIDLGGIIPEEMFNVVAEILAHVYSLKGKK